jgi:hypothetical protein
MLWIKIDDGDTFEGDLDQFEDCFFSNADMYSVLEWCEERRYKVEFSWK